MIFYYAQLFLLMTNKILFHIDRFQQKITTKKYKRMIIYAVIGINFMFYMIGNMLSEKLLLKEQSETTVGLSANELKTSPIYNYKKLFQTRQDAAGFSHKLGKKFIYFYYYKNLFPLATLEKNLIYSPQGADDEINQRGASLIMEYAHWARLGENARIFAYLPDAFVRLSPENPSIHLFNAICFCCGLLSILWGFEKIGYPLMGFLLVMMINFTPFFIYEVYIKQNIFGLAASTFLIVVGLNLPILFSKSVMPFKTISNIIISGALIGFFSQIRNEISIVLLTLILIYVCSNSFKLAYKIIYISLGFIAFYGTTHAIQAYFNAKFDQTTQFVQQHGGHVYTGGRTTGHKLWHPIYCGLGDYDEKYGYAWSDEDAYAYAVPILKNKYKIDVPYSDKTYLDTYYDKDKLYYKKFDEMPEYEQIVHDKVIHDMTNDPLWYINILIKRICKILTTTLPFPFIGWFIFPLMYQLIKRKKWDFIKLIVVSLPLSVSSLIIYSGKGNTYNSIFPYFILIIGLFILYEKKKTSALENV